MSTVRIERLVKYFHGRKVLRGLDLAWTGPGTLAVLGANGAGKSTLLRILGGVLAPDAGEIVVGGRSLRRERAGTLREIGYMPEGAEYPAHLSISELFDLVASLKGRPRPDLDADDPFHVAGLLRHRFGALSLGQRQRVCLCAALIGDPALLLLDEPSTGLDEDAVRKLVAVLRDRTARGRAAIVATHDRALADDVAAQCVSIEDGVIAPLVPI